MAIARPTALKSEKNAESTPTRIARHVTGRSQRSPPRLPPFEDIRNWVETDWLAVESRDRVDEALATMREEYNVVVEPVAEPE